MSPDPPPPQLKYVLCYCMLDYEKILYKSLAGFQRGAGDSILVPPYVHFWQATIEPLQLP